VSPSIEDGQPAPALHFGDPRVMALLAYLCSFQHPFAGLTNRILRPQIAELIGGYSTGQMTTTAVARPRSGDRGDHRQHRPCLVVH
jgi:hypothetical protein